MLAFLCGDPLQHSFHRAEDMGAGGGYGGELEPALGVSALAGGLLDIRGIDPQGRPNKILVEVVGAELVGVSAT